MPRGRPEKQIVIAHRGASGYLPEHTLMSKALAYGMGADFLEQDVVASADGAAMVFHDLVLDHTTDVQSRFPGRSRDDGRYYVLDFTVAELRQLNVTERRRPGSEQARWPNRFAANTGRFQMVTLADELRLIKELNRTTGGTVGAYVEIKQPAWHHQQGVDLSRIVLNCLHESGLPSASEPVFLQCFDYAELRRLRHEFGTSLPLIQLLRSPTSRNKTSDFGYLCSPDGLAELAQTVAGIGPRFSQLLKTDPDGVWRPSTVFTAARSLGLLIHPYTFRADDLPTGAASLEHLLAFFFHELQVDGLFCDFPDRAVRVRDRQPAINPGES
jgi:glycerophosphoryl diester phosphodiesterase